MMAVPAIARRLTLEILVPDRHLKSGVDQERQFEDQIGLTVLPKRQTNDCLPLKGSTSRHVDGQKLAHVQVFAARRLRRTKLENPMMRDGQQHALSL